jgi:cytochrome P450
MEIATLTRWYLGFGLGRSSLRAAARRGDMIPRALVDPSLQADPYPFFEQLRARGPVVQERLTAATTSHAATKELLRSPDVGVGGGHGELPKPLRRLLAGLQHAHVLGPMDPPSMLAVDAPRHTRYRRLISREFTARAVARHEERIQAVAERLLDELASESGEVDIVQRYATLLPVAVIGDLLGIPDDQRDELLRLGNDAALTLDPGLGLAAYRRAERSIRELHAMIETHIVRLREPPGEDLLSRLVMIEGDDALTDIELHSIALLTLGAGFETTVNLIGHGVLLLAEHPEQRVLLAEQPQLWPNAIEEMLRIQPPVQFTLRLTYVPTTIAGVPVAKGMPVTAMIAAANRDPAVFPEPDRFDVTRANAHEHLAFSAGEHYCVGSGLARLEGAIALRTLFERFPDLVVTGTPELRETRVLRGYDRIPVVLGARVAAG